MKKFIIGFFREFPTCTGLLLLLISCHFLGIKDFTEPWAKAPKVFWDIIIIYLLVAYIFITFCIQNLEASMRERATWIVILISVIVLVTLAKLFAY